MYEGMRSYNEFNRYRIDATVQVIDLFNFSFLLWIFRPRKEWPEYFSLGLADTGRLANRNNNNNQLVQAPMVPIRNAVISSKYFIGQDSSLRNKFGDGLKENSHSFNSGSSFDSFGSLGLDEALVILNPFEFTVAPEMQQQSTPDEIVEESSLIEKTP